MKVSYTREMKRSYMVMEPEPGAGASYEAKMLSDNCIPGLLAMKLKYRDGGSICCYDITSRQPLSRILEVRALTRAELEQLLIQLNELSDQLTRHLLGDGGILLEPELIYLEPEGFYLQFCMVPGREADFWQELSRLFQYLLKHVDHRDRESVVLAYGMYQESLKDNYGMDDLMTLLRRGKDEEAAVREEKVGAWSEKRSEGRSEKRSERRSERRSEERLEKRSEKGSELTAEYRWGKDYGREQSVEAELPEGTGERKEKDKQRWKSGEKREEKLRRKPGYIFTLVRKILGGIMAAALAPGLIWLLAGKTRFVELLPLILAGEGVLTAVILLFSLLRPAGKADYRAYGELYIPEDEWEKQYLREEEFEQIPEQPCQSSSSLSSAFGPSVSGFSASEYSGSDSSVPEDFQTVLLCSDSIPECHRLESLRPEEEDILIPYFPFVIGKHGGLADYVLDRNTVSRFHLRIDRSQEHFTITDLNSTNGTSAAGRLLAANETAEIAPGDEIRIADLSYVWR